MSNLDNAVWCAHVLRLVIATCKIGVWESSTDEGSVYTYNLCVQLHA